MQQLMLRNLKTRAVFVDVSHLGHRKHQDKANWYCCLILKRRECWPKGRRFRRCLHVTPTGHLISERKLQNKNKKRVSKEKVMVISPLARLVWTRARTQISSSAFSGVRSWTRTNVLSSSDTQRRTNIL